MAGSQGAGVDTVGPAGWTQAWAGGPPRPVVAGPAAPRALWLLGRGLILARGGAL